MNLKDSSNSLRLLQRIVTTTRSLAYHEADTQMIAGILDEADNLINLLLHGEEETNEFKQALEHLGTKYPQLAGLSNEYAPPIAA